MLTIVVTVSRQSGGKSRGRYSGPMASSGNSKMPANNAIRYRNNAKNRSATGCRTSCWPYAMVMASTKADMADDPAQKLMIRPTDTTSLRPLPRIVSTVLPTRLSATSLLKITCRKVKTCARTSSLVPGGNQWVTYPTRPSRASSSGAVDRALQNAACELNPNSESPQALDAVRPAILRQRCRTGPLAVGIGPVPGRCQGTVCCITGEVIEVDGWGRSSATVADWSAGLETCRADGGGTRTVSSATGAVGGVGRGPEPYGSSAYGSVGYGGSTSEGGMACHPVPRSGTACTGPPGPAALVTS